MWGKACQTRQEVVFANFLSTGFVFTVADITPVRRMFGPLSVINTVASKNGPNLQYLGNQGNPMQPIPQEYICIAESEFP